MFFQSPIGYRLLNVVLDQNTPFSAGKSPKKPGKGRKDVPGDGHELLAPQDAGDFGGGVECDRLLPYFVVPIDQTKVKISYINLEF